MTNANLRSRGALRCAVATVIESLERRQLLAFQAGINFGSYASEAEVGYITDTGDAYGVRQSGLTYGWNANLSGRGFDRSTALQSRKYNTGINTTGTGNAWEIAVPNGTYYVRLVAGDANVTSGTYKYNVEGTTNFLSGSAATGNAAWVSATGTVVVNDGKLTVSNGSGASAYNLAFVDIVDLTAKNRASVGAATNLAARARQTTVVDLTWIDNADNEDFDGGYLIERRTGNGAYAQISSSGGGIRQLFTDTNVVAGTTYTYRVRAKRTNTSNQSIISSYSNEATVTTPASNTQASYLGTPYATGSQIEAEDYDKGVAGDAYNDSTGANAGGFYRSGSTDIGIYLPTSEYYVGWIDTNDWQEYTVNIATAGNYYVDANVSSAGQGGTWKVQVGGADKATAIQVANTGGFDQFAVQSSSTFSLTSGNNQIFRFQATGLDAGNTFVGNFDYFKIQRFDAPGSVTAAAASSSQINLSWTKLASNPSGFVIERKIGSNGTYAAIATLDPSATTWQDAGLSAGTQYYYRLRATRNYNGSTAYTAYSAEAFATTTTPSSVPAAASSLTAAASAGRITLAWADGSTNETGFKVQRKQGTDAWSTLYTTNANVMSYVDLSVTGGQTYSYQVIATNGIGDAAASNIAAATAANNVTLTPVADAYGQSGSNADANFGGSTELDIKNNSTAGYDRQGYFKFDLSSLTANVSSVKLQIYGKRNNTNDSGNISFNVNGVADTTWTESDLTYNNRPAMGSVVGTFVSAAPNSSYALYEVDVTSYVQSQLAAGRTTISLGIASTTVGASAYLIIPSKEAAANKPQLLIALNSNASPTIATAATASPNPVIGTTANLSVLGADDGGEGNLTYTWSTLTRPTGSTTPFFNANGTNAAKNVIATFYQSGAYTFLATISDGTTTKTSSVSVVVNQTLSATTLSPSTTTISPGSIQQFTVIQTDQFGFAMSTQPTFTWSVVSGAGTITQGGAYTAGNNTGTATVRATAGSVVRNATVNVSYVEPFIQDPASATPNPVTGTTAILHVLGSDDGGDSNFTYVWNATGPAPVTYSGPMYTNASKDQTVIFTKAGTYSFVGTVHSSSGDITSNTTVVVNQTLTAIVVTPDTTFVAPGSTKQFSAVAVDQFGQALATQPALTWSVTSGTGTVSSSGLYTAPATNGSALINVMSGGITSTATITVNNSAPTVATAASATPNPVTGTTANLSVFGADDGGEAYLTYAWSTTSKPSGAADPTFSTNGTNGSKNTTATFSQAGAYTFLANISDGTGSATSNVSVVVNAVATSIVVTPGTIAVGPNGSQQFTAVAKDQFGQSITTQPTFTWSKLSGPGGVSSAGLYSATATTGTVVLRAAAGALFGDATITVSNGAPTVATPASANPGTVTGTTTNLSVLGADDGGEAALTYTWSVSNKPAGAADPIFSANGSNASKNTTATFTQAGSYTFVSTISDGTTPTTSSVTVVVNQTLTAITLTPGIATLTTGGSQQFTAIAKDQFGQALNTQPAFTWSVLTGGTGTVSAAGLYTAPSSNGSATVQVAGGGVAATAGLTIANAAPTIATAASATPAPVTGTTTNLMVLGADDGGESNLNYSWAASGPAAVTYSVANGHNNSKNTVATFTKAGTYTLIATISDGTNSIAAPAVTVVVNQTVTSIAVSPGTATVAPNATQSFSASATDQFGQTFTTQPTFTWSVPSGGGSFTGNTYAAPTSGGSATVQAAVNGVSGTATVTIANAPPTVAIDPSASPNPVTGTTTTLSVLGADDGGESNLTYTWSFIPVYGDNNEPTFSDLHAKTTTATFSEAGTYQFQVQISDGTYSIFPTVDVTVNPTLSGLSVTPAGSSVAAGGTRQFSVLGVDQFGLSLASPSPLTWSVLSGGGGFSGNGLYTASNTPGPATVQAAFGSLSGVAMVTINNAAPTVATAASASPAVVTNGTTTLSVLGADNGGESNLKYEWSFIPIYGDNNEPTFSDLHAKTTTATFTQVGTYALQVKIKDAQGLLAYSNVDVEVQQVAVNLTITPGTSNLNAGDTQQFHVYATDEFGQQINNPAVTWTADHGNIDSAGFYNSNGVTDADVIHATLGTVTANANIAINPAIPGTLSATMANESEANLTWTDSSDGETGFIIEASRAGGPFAQMLVTPPNATGWSVTGLQPSTFYRFRVRAVLNGLASDPSNVVTVNTSNLPAVNGPTLTWSNGQGLFYRGQEYTKLTISNLVAGKKYVVAISPNFGGTWDGNTTVNGFGPDSWKATHNGQTLVDAYYSIVGAPYSTFTQADYDHLIVHFTAGTGDEVFEFSSHTTNATPGTGYDRYFAHPEEDEWWSISAGLSEDAADGKPVVSIAATDAEAWETPLTSSQDNKLTFTVTRSGNEEDGDFDEALTVLLHPPAGTATPSDDYTGLPSSVTIAAGQSSATFDVTAVQDNLAEADETLALCLKAAQDYRLAAFTAIATIHDVSGNIGFNNDNGKASDPDDKLLPGTPDASFIIDKDDEKTEETGAGFKFWWGTNTGGPQFTPDNVTDLAPFIVDIPELPANSGLVPYLKLESTNGQGGLFFIYPNSGGADSRLKYLSDFQTAQTLSDASSGQTFRALGGSITETLLVDRQGQPLTAGHYEFLIRGVGSGLVSVKFTIELKPQQGNAIPLDTANVTFENPTNFYSVISSRDAAQRTPFLYASEDGRSDVIDAYKYTVKRDVRQTGVKKTVIFIHGYNNSAEDAENTFATSYERMYWQGFRGNFVGWDWDAQQWLDPLAFSVDTKNALYTSPTLWMAIRNLMEVSPDDGGWGLQASDIDLVAHSLGNLVMWDALRINAAQTADKLVNNVTSIEAAIFSEAFDPRSNLDYTVPADDNGNSPGLLVHETVFEQQQSGWRSWLNPLGRTLKSGITGKIINSYADDDSALSYYMRLNEDILAGDSISQRSVFYHFSPLYRTASNLSSLTTYIRHDATVGYGRDALDNDRWSFGYYDLNLPIGTMPNPLADININAKNGLGWRATQHSDFRDRDLPEIWNWWKNVMVNSGAIRIGEQI